MTRFICIKICSFHIPKIIDFTNIGCNPNLTRTNQNPTQNEKKYSQPEQVTIREKKKNYRTQKPTRRSDEVWIELDYPTR